MCSHCNHGLWPGWWEGWRSPEVLASLVAKAVLKLAKAAASILALRTGFAALVMLLRQTAFAMLGCEARVTDFFWTLRG